MVEALEVVLEEVRIDVQRNRRSGMSKLLLDRLYRCSLLDEQARAAVAKMMRGQALWKGFPC